MYQITTKNPVTEQQTTLSLPLTDLELEQNLKEIGITTIDDPIELSGFANEDYDFPQLPARMLDQADIFQINFLAQRIDTLSTSEQEDMNIIIEAYDKSDITDLINLTYEIENGLYHVLEGIENHDDLGRWFVEENCGDVPDVILDNVDYADVGHDLDSYEYGGVFCSRGYAYEESPMADKPYDGRRFPGFTYEQNCIANLQYVNDDNGLVSYLKLPAGDFAMQRVLKELECESFDDCRIDIFTSKIFGRYDYLTEKDDIEKLNELCKELASLDEKDFAKLNAVVQYAMVSDDEIFCRLGAENDTAYEKLNALYLHLEDFDFFPGIHSPEAYADHLVNNIKFFEVSEELTPYINYRELGRDWAEGEGGRFVPGGYVIDESPIVPERAPLQENEQDLEI